VVGEVGLAVEEGPAAWNLAWSMAGRREGGMHQVVREVHGTSASLLTILVPMLFRATTKSMAWRGCDPPFGYRGWGWSDRRGEERG